MAKVHVLVEIETSAIVSPIYFEKTESLPYDPEESPELAMDTLTALGRQAELAVRHQAHMLWNVPVRAGRAA